MCYVSFKVFELNGDAMKERTLLNFSVDSSLATVTINNFHPVKLTKDLQQVNTLDTRLFCEIDRRLDEIEQRGSVQGVVFTGINPEGYYPVFCDGIDLTFLAGLKFLDFGDDMRWEVINHHVGLEVLNRICSTEQYFIARLNGVCIGGGLEFALGMDYLISLPKMLVGFPEAKYGMLPGWNGLQSLACKIGKDEALDLYFEGFFEPSGKPFHRNGIVSAEKACELGIVNEVVPSFDVMDKRIDEVVDEFISGRRQRRSKPVLRPYKMFPEK